MLAAIKFYHKTLRRTVKVNHIGADGMLSSEFIVQQVAPAQCIPKLLLGIRGFTPERSGKQVLPFALKVSHTNPSPELRSTSPLKKGRGSGSRSSQTPSPLFKGRGRGEGFMPLPHNSHPSLTRECSRKQVSPLALKVSHTNPSPELRSTSPLKKGRGSGSRSSQTPSFRPKRRGSESCSSQTPSPFFKGRGRG